MKQALIILIALLVAIALRAQHEAPPADHVAHGAEKQAHKVAHPTEDHGAGHEAPKTYFGIPGWIWKTVNMVVFVGVLFYLLKGPVGGMLAARGESIRKELAVAQERRQKSDQLASDIQQRLSQIEGEVQSILQRAGDEGRRQRQELIEAAEAEGQKILAAARGEVEARLKQARRELTEFAGELAAKRAEEMLASSLTDNDRKKIFQDSVAQLEESQG